MSDHDASYFSVYEQIRKEAKDGDILLVSGSGAISLMIRAATFSKMSHVAVFLWIDSGLWVFEAKEFQGLRFVPASLYIKDQLDAGRNIYFGRAPKVVRESENMVYDTAMNYRNASYGYHALFTVLAAQIMSRYYKGIEIDSDSVVCSILVQKIWEACGHEFPRLMSPGYFVDESDFTVKIKSMTADIGDDENDLKVIAPGVIVDENEVKPEAEKEPDNTV